jgi:hypothetical protein
MTTTRLGWTAALTGDVRANGRYRLRALDSLPGSYRASLEGLGVDTSRVHGLLLAGPGSELPDKIVDESAAGLFASLQRPARPDLAPERLAALVLDGVLEIDGPQGFVCGPAAYAAAGGSGPAPAPGGRLAAMSRAALDYAERLRLPSVDALTARLYAYHRIPFSPRWARAYPDPEAVREVLPRRLLATHWSGPAGGEQQYWLSWSPRRGTRPPGGLPYKLYVSPRIEDLPEVLPPIVAALAAAGAPRFKIGSDAAGLLRPDKIVVYLRDAQETAAVAAAVADAVTGTPAHGVPFSAELAGDGVISWGGDPPRDAGPAGRRAESWRLSVCRRLAEHLVAAAAVPGVRPADFALARLALDGVDVASFAPAGLPAPAGP